MVGIYKITNKLTNKAYVGQSTDIARRFKEHCTKGETSRIPLDRDILTFGSQNFELEILEECNVDDLNKRETYWITTLDTVNNGYNQNYGGTTSLSGELNPTAKLTEKDVVNIRKAYLEHRSQKEIYELYKDKITFNYFQSVWQGKSWSHIMPEVFTSENKEYYSKKNSLGEKSANAKFTDEEVIIMRKRYVNESAADIFKDYKDRVKYSSLQQILWGRQYKHLPIYSKKTKQWINN